MSTYFVSVSTHLFPHLRISYPNQSGCPELLIITLGERLLDGSGMNWKRLQRPKERIAGGERARERGNEGGVEGSTLSTERHRQLSHISGLIGTDKVLLEDSVPTALFALESQGQIYYD